MYKACLQCKAILLILQCVIRNFIYSGACGKLGASFSKLINLSGFNFILLFRNRYGAWLIFKQRKQLSYQSLEDSFVGPVSVLEIFVSVLNNLSQILLSVKEAVSVAEVAQLVYLKTKR